MERKSVFFSTSSRHPAVASLSKYGLIAGNGKFPFLVLEAARSQGIEMVVAAIKEETFPEIEQHAKTVHWMSLGQLGKLIKTFKDEGVNRAVMAGQVKHKQIFSTIVPDLKMIQALASVATKNTDSLIGAVAKVLEDEGISLMESTAFLKPLLPEPGVLTKRSPTDEEKRDLDYGYRIARDLGRLDLGQSVAVSEAACVALEAMEGTDAVMERAASLVNGKPLRIVKLAKPNQDLRFDVPVIGPATVRLMARLNVSALAIEARKTLMIDREELIREADEKGIAIVAVE
ncbi:MAG: UDP-2,3-diacylglucosamine diphosphatase LpxI [Acidobacteria bacterium]|nr:UDP-2,3-diacylglucosamine diphosphatase LpxI [Acidobacteriota bacterium]